jgi:hypothetical protein
VNLNWIEKEGEQAKEEGIFCSVEDFGATCDDY